MITTLKEHLFTGWHMMRFIGLALGLFFGFQALAFQEAIAGFLSFFFLFQVVMNVGCFGRSGCSVPETKNQQAIEDVEFTEIKRNS